MEPIELFAAVVLTICTLHLASVAGVHIETWWRKTGGTEKTATGRTGQRSDWYAFFHCADLVGPDPSPTDNPPPRQQQKEVTKKRSSQDRRARVSV